MAVDSKFFSIPFATSGDKISIPEAVQPSGAISFTQGYGPDYERDPATDPLAKRVPRDETNELYYQITNSLRYLQLYGLPQYTSVADGGPANYPLTARVRHDAGAGMQAWISIVAANTAIPGSDATKWALDEFFNLATLEASLAEALAATIGTKIVTPRRLGSAVQRGQWNYAVAAGSANALTATLAPAPAAVTDGMVVSILISATNTAAATLNVNGLGTDAIVNTNGGALVAGDLVVGNVVQFIRRAGQWRINGVSRGRLLNTQIFKVAGASVYTPTPGTQYVEVEVQGGGGGAGGSPATNASQVSAAGNGGAGAYARKIITSGFAGVTVTVGAGGAGNPGGAGQTGGTSSFGGLVSASGGGGGSTAGPTGVSTQFIALGGAGAGSGASGDINLAGLPGGGTLVINQQGFTSPISAAMFSGGYGWGGAGNSSPPSTPAVTGQTGGGGLVIVREYA